MTKHRKTYLILADDSDEFQTALHYAAVSAKKKNANIAVLRVLSETDFQHWGSVEARMKQEQREAAEAHMKIVSTQIEAIHGDSPKIIIDEGTKSEAILRALENDPIITKLILAGSTNPAGPGPLIEYFAGHGIEQLNVALTIIPGHLSNADIEALI